MKGTFTNVSFKIMKKGFLLGKFLQLLRMNKSDNHDIFDIFFFCCFDIATNSLHFQDLSVVFLGGCGWGRGFSFGFGLAVFHSDLTRRLNLLNTNLCPLDSSILIKLDESIC